MYSSTSCPLWRSQHTRLTKLYTDYSQQLEAFAMTARPEALQELTKLQTEIEAAAEALHELVDPLRVVERTKLKRQYNLHNIQPFYDGMAAVEYQGFAMGYVGRSGQLMRARGSEEHMSWSEVSSFENGFGLIQTPGRWYRYVRPDGSFLTDPVSSVTLEFADADSFHHGFAAVFVNEGWRILTTGGSLVMNPVTQQPLAIDMGGALEYQDGIIRFRETDGQQYGYLAPDGQVLSKTRPDGKLELLLFKKADCFQDGLAIVHAMNGYCVLKKDGSFVIDPNTKQPLWVRTINQLLITGGLIACQADKHSTSYLTPNEEWLKQPDGAVLTVQDHEQFSHGLAVVQTQGGQWSVLRTDGSLVCDPRTGAPIAVEKRVNVDAGEGFVLFKNREGLYEYVRPDGSWLTAPGSDQPLQFQWAWKFIGGLAAVIGDGKLCHLLRPDGSLVLDPTTQRPLAVAQTPQTTQAAGGRKTVTQLLGGLYGHVFPDGTVLRDAKKSAHRPRMLAWQHATEFRNGLAEVTAVGGRSYYLKLNGSVLTHPETRRPLNTSIWLRQGTSDSGFDELYDETDVRTIYTNAFGEVVNYV